MSKKESILELNVREVIGTKAGKDVLWNILSMCNLYGDNFTGNSQTFYLEGKRSIGLEILQMLEDADPTVYARMLLERQDKDKEEEQNG